MSLECVGYMHACHNTYHNFVIPCILKVLERESVFPSVALHVYMPGSLPDTCRVLV